MLATNWNYAVVDKVNELQVWMCLTGCETWIREEGVASLGGRLYPFISLSACLQLCLEMSTCVAVDHSVAFCSVHTNINDTATTFADPSFSQYTLNRACLSSTPSRASSFTSSTGQTPTESTYPGKWRTKRT